MAVFKCPIGEALKKLDEYEAKGVLLAGASGQFIDNSGTLEKIEWIMDFSKQDKSNRIQSVRAFVRYLSEEGCNWIEFTGDF